VQSVDVNDEEGDSPRSGLFFVCVSMLRVGIEFEQSLMRFEIEGSTLFYVSAIRYYEGATFLPMGGLSAGVIWTAALPCVGGGAAECRSIRGDPGVRKKK